MSFSGTVRLRPLRIALLVSPTDIKSIRHWMRLCVCLWGGIHNPIIPFIERTPSRWRDLRSSIRGSDIGKGYLRFFEPDVLVEAKNGSAVKIGWNAGKSWMRSRRLESLATFVSTDDLARAEFSEGTDIIHKYIHLYERDYKFQRRHQDTFAEVADGSNDAFFEAVVGKFPEDERLIYLPTSYRKAFDPVTLENSPESLIKLLTERPRTPLWVTREGLDGTWNDRGDPRVFIFDPRDGQDLIDYWNLRQCERGAIPIHVDWIKQCSEFLRDMILRNHRPLPRNKNGVMIHTTLEFARSIGETRAKQIMETYFQGLPSGSFAYKTWYDPIWMDKISDVMWRTSRVQLTSEEIEIDQQVNGDSAKFQTLSPDFIKSAPGLPKAGWANVFRARPRMSGGDIATLFPSNVSDPIFPELGISEWSTVSREGWVFPQRYDGGHQFINLVAGRQAFIEWFQRKGLVAIPSDAGRVAEQIIAAAGNLHRCAMFANESMIKLLDEMATSTVQRIADKAESRVPDRAVPVGRWEQLLGEGKGRRGFATLDNLIKASVLRAGLQIQCPHCMQQNWFDVKALDFKVACSRCLKEFTFPQSPRDLRSMKWFYRVVGPFSAPGYAQGGYAVALALHTFAHRLSEVDVTWSTGLELSKGGIKVEIDFALWYRRRRIHGEDEEPVTMIGEAKSFAKEAVSKEDLEKLKTVAELLPGAVMVVALLKRDLSKDESRHLTALAKWGRRNLNGRPRNPLVVLTGRELFGGWSLQTAWKDAGGLAASLSEPAYIDLANPYVLAELTQQLYLGLPSIFEERRQAHQRRGNTIQSNRKQTKQSEL